MAVYGLTSTGFVPKPFNVIQAELQVEYKAIHGQDLDVSDDSLAGQEINNLAKKYADFWEGMGALFASFNPDTNVGKSLDGSAALVGVTRPEPLPSEANVIMYGDELTVVPADTTIEQTTTELQFKLDVDTTITKTDAVDSTISCIADPINGEIFTVTIDSAPYSHTVIGTQTKQEVLHELYLLIVAAVLDITTTEGTESLRFVADDLTIPFSIEVNAKLQIDVLGCNGRFVCTVDGVNFIPVGTLQTILTPVTGLDSVNNITEGIAGRDVMEDDVFRIYRRNNLQTNAKATEEAIQANVNEIQNVTYTKVISNRTNAPDGAGRPAKSFECIVNGGNQVEIAEVIWLTMPAGIEPYGNITEIVKDSLGRDQTIKFSRPVLKYVWMQIEINSSGKEPGNVTELIKSAIYEWSKDINNVNIGTDIIFEKHYTPVYSIEGVEETNFMRIGVSDNPLIPPVSYVTVNIVLDDVNLAEYSIERMEVNIV